MQAVTDAVLPPSLDQWVFEWFAQRLRRHAAGRGATPTNNVCRRTAHAGDNTDGGDQCFCIVAARVIGKLLLVRRLVKLEEK